MTSPKILEGNDCTELFRNAYLNRYTWDEDFSGYKGTCFMDYKNNSYQGKFAISKDLKVIVEGINEEEIKKQVASQLWEVAIHRVRRSFESVHGLNSFTAGDFDKVGQEVLVGGKSKGDKYKVKDNIVTMVYRHIHGSLIRIYTTNTIDTGMGYLSKTYNSQYFNPSSNEPNSPISFFEDEFIPVNKDGPWVLSKRVIKLEDSENIFYDIKSFVFNDITIL